MKINIHAGHNPDGKTACGAVGLIKESTEARNVKNKVISMLKSQGHTVYDCTCENGTSQNDVLKKIVAKCNENTVDLDISIHFNSGANDKAGNGATTGTEVFVYSTTSKAKSYAQNIVNAIVALGFKNRGVKYSTSLYVLKNTKSPALLIECCFVDDKDDAGLYNVDKMAAAIVKGITGVEPSYTSNSTTSSSTIYRVRKSWSDASSQIGAFSSLDGAKSVCKDGYYVFDGNGNIVYPVQTNTSNNVNNVSTESFQIKLLEDLNIRKTPNGTIVQINGAKKGVIYTIVEIQGSWGRLKSGAGWISVSDKYVKRV